MKKIFDHIELLFLAIIIAGIVCFTQCDRIGNFIRIAEGDIVVPIGTLAKWDSLLALPPQIEIDTFYQDTGSVKIVYQKVPVIQPIDSTRYILKDSITTEFFRATHTLFFYKGDPSPFDNIWTHTYYGPKKIVVTKTHYIPKLIPYEVMIDPKGVYLGMGTSLSQYIYSYGINVDYINKRLMYGAYAHKQRFFGEDKSTISVGLKASYKIK